MLLALHELFPKAPLYASVINKKTARWAVRFDVKTSFLQSFPFATVSHESYPLLMPLVFEHFTFDGYDLVISITSESAKGIITKPHTMHVCYCLTPTRYLWSGYEEYFSNPFFRAIAYPGTSYLKYWDRIAGQRPDAYIAISKEVQRRMKTYYGRESIVIYPPVTIDGRRWDIEDRRSTINHLSSKGYFLVVSRLVEYKRIDLAIRACNQLKIPLKIIGTGREEKKLRSLAGPTVEFLGNLTDSELLRYYRECWALLFCGVEDFGIVMVEALLSGKPVLAFKKGGALEIIKEGKTGLFFYPQTTQALITAIQTFQQKTFLSEDCRSQGDTFSKKTFMKTFQATIGDLFHKYRKNARV